jgi:hypothetical protein
VEMTLALFIAGVLIVGMDGLLSTALKSHQYSQNQNDTLQQARFAMQQMTRAVAGTRRLMIPLGENSATAWSESVRDVLAVTLDPTMDRDQDGWADANNDKDYLDINNNGSRDAGEPERVDEDLANDNTNDSAPGIVDIDDNGDGTSDNSSALSPIVDNDEDNVETEDSINNVDSDNDGAMDEDIQQDMNRDVAPGIKNFDDDFDGSVDEGFIHDDDEDGTTGEDWFDPVVFFLNGATLMQRLPNIDPVDGTDYTEYPIADNVTQLQVERLIGNDGVTVLVDITLQISPSNIEPITLNTRVRVGGAL